MPVAHINDVDLYYEEHGQGDPVFLIPGLGGVGLGWGPQIPLFATKFRTIVVDHRGVGKSSQPETGHTIAQHASDMAGLLRALKAIPADIVGVSTGGAIAQVMALDHPDTVRSLVLVASWARADVRFRQMFELRKAVLSQLGPEAAMQLAFLILYSPVYYRAHCEYWEPLMRQLSAHPPDTSVAIKRIEMIVAHDAFDRLGEIRIPTCIVAGELDVVTPVYFSQELNRQIPHSELRVIPGAGHSVYAEQPDAFFGIVDDFLRRVSG
ncbi:MAG: alpha/beta fold hydrolase [Bryobacteraceae bacterium]